MFPLRGGGLTFPHFGDRRVPFGEASHSLVLPRDDRPGIEQMVTHTKLGRGRGWNPAIPGRLLWRLRQAQPR